MSEQQYLESRPGAGRGTIDDLELDREEWAGRLPAGAHPGAVVSVRGIHERDLHRDGHGRRDRVHGRDPAPDPAGDLLCDQRVRGGKKLVTAFPTECDGEPDCWISQVADGPIPFFSLA